MSIITRVEYIDLNEALPKARFTAAAAAASSAVIRCRCCRRRNPPRYCRPTFAV